MMFENIPNGRQLPCYVQVFNDLATSLSVENELRSSEFNDHQL